jgi:hypothetical protein
MYEFGRAAQPKAGITHSAGLFATKTSSEELLSSCKTAPASARRLLSVKRE